MSRTATTILTCAKVSFALLAGMVICERWDAAVGLSNRDISPPPPLIADLRQAPLHLPPTSVAPPTDVHRISFQHENPVLPIQNIPVEVEAPRPEPVAEPVTEPLREPTPTAFEAGAKDLSPIVGRSRPQPVQVQEAPAVVFDAPPRAVRAMMIEVAHRAIPSRRTTAAEEMSPPPIQPTAVVQETPHEELPRRRPSIPLPLSTQPGKRMAPRASEPVLQPKAEVPTPFGDDPEPEPQPAPAPTPGLEPLPGRSPAPAPQAAAASNGWLPPAGEKGFGRIKPIGNISLQTSPPPEVAADGAPLSVPEDLASARLAGAPGYERSVPELFPTNDVAIESLGFCYQPLYFEEPLLERFDKSYGVFQPAVSTVRFYANIGLMPWHLYQQPARRCTNRHWNALPGTISGSRRFFDRGR